MTKQHIKGAIVVTAVVALHALPRFESALNVALSNVVYWSIEVSILIAILSATFRWTKRRGWSASAMLTGSVVVSAAWGALLAMVYTRVATYIPSFQVVEFPAPTTRLIRLGATVAVAHCGIWSLAYFYPAAIDSERMRTTAELARLRSQLEPHFLLNSLNAVAGLVTKDPAQARRLLAILGELLEDTLVADEDHQTLDREVAWLRRYAEILETRHAGNLGFSWKIDPAALSLSIPRLLLQPLVENAVKHGALARDGGGEVVVRANLAQLTSGSRLICIVEDNGPGMDTAQVRPAALGLRLVRRRLELHDDGSELRLESSPNGTRAILELPIRSRRATVLLGSPSFS